MPVTVQPARDGIAVSRTQLSFGGRLKLWVQAHNLRVWNLRIAESGYQRINDYDDLDYVVHHGTIVFYFMDCTALVADARAVLSAAAAIDNLVSRMDALSRTPGGFPFTLLFAKADALTRQERTELESLIEGYVDVVSGSSVLSVEGRLQADERLVGTPRGREFEESKSALRKIFQNIRARPLQVYFVSAGAVAREHQYTADDFLDLQLWSKADDDSETGTSTLSASGGNLPDMDLGEHLGPMASSTSEHLSTSQQQPTKFKNVQYTVDWLNELLIPFVTALSNLRWR